MLIISAYELCILTFNFIKTNPVSGFRWVFSKIPSIELSLPASTNTMTLN